MGTRQVGMAEVVAVVLLCCTAGCFAVAAASSPVEQTPLTFQEFKAKFSKVYATPEEEARRAAVFTENMRFIARHNEEASQGLHTHVVGLNAFADLTREEFRQHYLTMPQLFQQRKHHRHNHASSTPASSTSSSPVPLTPLPVQANKSVDWRARGDVTPVRNQGQCGAPWAYSAVEVVESMHAIATGNLVDLSIQQIIDCSSPYGTQGCSGGTMQVAFRYIAANGGLDSAADYPMTDRAEPCNKRKEARHVAKVAGFRAVPANNETLLADAVAVRPVAVGIEADTPSFQMYSGGVYSGPCGTELDHAVVVVGYTPEYWIVKNSWGESWGEQGYIMMKRGVGPHGICGITLDALYPLPANNSSIS